MNKIDLPEEWQSASLETLFVHVIGGDWGQDCEFDNPDFFKAFCIRGAEFKSWNQNRGSTASLRKIKSSSLKLRQLEPGDILIEISGGGPDQPVGRTVLIDTLVINQFNGKPIVCTNFLRLARPARSINPTYLNGYLRSFYLSGEVINYQGGSNNLRNLKFKDYSQILIPVPPLVEQQQIAARLDELLAQVDTIKTRLDAIPKILKRFRQSVLAAAVSGKLTEEWRQVNDKFEPIEMLDWKWSPIPSGWEVFYYADLIQSRLGKMLDKAKNVGISTRYLRNINVRWFDIDLTNLQEILVSDKEQTDLTVKIGDVLICEGGEPGRCAIWKVESETPIIFQKALHQARVGKKRIPEWLAYNLKNDCENNSMNQLFTGTTIKHLTGKALRKYPLRISPIKEQIEIVNRVEQLFAYADQIEQRIKDAQKRVNHLPQSILAKAFRGELTADWREQNPELISGENSAEALLAKIKAERETIAATHQGRRKAKA